MHEKIHRHIAERGSASAEEIARLFLRMTAIDSALARRLVRSVLGESEAFREEPDGTWLVRERPTRSLSSETFASVALSSERHAPGDDRWRYACEFRAGGRPTGLAGTDAARPPAAVARELAERTRGTIPAAFREEPLRTWLARATTPGDPAPFVCSIRALGRALALGPAKSLGEVASVLGLRGLDTEDLPLRAAFTGEVLDALVEEAAARGARDVADLERLCEREPARVDFDRFAFDREALRALPMRPGIYIMRDASGVCTYVGKARRLRARVWSYFRPGMATDPRVAEILQHLHALETRETGSELGAILAEHEAIETLSPRLNTQRVIHDRRPPPLLPVAALVNAPGEGMVRLYAIGRSVVRSLDFPRANPPRKEIERLVRTVLRPPHRIGAGEAERAWLAARNIWRARDSMAIVDLRLVVRPAEGAERLVRLSGVLDGEEPAGWRVT